MPTPPGGSSVGTVPPPTKEYRSWGKALLKALLKTATVTVGVALVIGVFRHPVFAVSQVDVTGLHRLSLSSVMERVSLHGEHLLALPVEDVQASLAQEPWIRRVDIQRQMPSRVTLSVQEREPIVIWQVGQRQFLADRDGTILEENFVPRDLLVIHDLDGTAPEPGERKDPDIMALALTLHQVLAAELGQSAKAFEYLSNGGLVVETDAGRRARFGDSSDFQWKLAVWKALLETGEAEDLQVGHVDLRFGDRPFFRP